MSDKERAIESVCECGRPFPWRTLLEKHVGSLYDCACGRTWRIAQEGKFVYVELELDVVSIEQVPLPRTAQTKWFAAQNEKSALGPGPFDSREEAIEAGNEEFADQVSFDVFETEEVVPEDFVWSKDDVDELLDRMDQHVSDTCGADEPTLSLVDGSEEEARKDFERLLRAWARKYVRCSWYHTIRSEEAQVSS